ncbi:nitroreductase family protein [Sapientia aquatica]|uniref:Nitroreductase family protein n=1 Tax=Sapientia aquatica TaxID=1549640 RepID=A0A4R5VYS3_9BURK|nr:nitroreductase family protein [Sapientia aquatica]TDK64498.1 nitroreductase family protein [Sapientia aquatica]
MSNTVDIIKQRTSANNFDPTSVLSTEEIEALVQLAIETPTSFNMQNWRVVAITSPAAKEEFKALAYGQPKVKDAAVTFAFIGKLNGYQDLPTLIKPLLDAKAIDQAAYDGWIGMAKGMYEGHPQNQRDEAIRSSAFAAMTLMYAAQDKGLVSGPMIGFDATGVAQALGLGENEFPVLLLAVGKPAPGNWPRKPRKNLSEVLSIK